MRSQLDLFGGRRIQMDESIRLTCDSLGVYGPTHKHWAVAWSGGKDSTTTLTLLLHLIESGQVPRPETLTVLYADTRMELLPLWLAAEAIREELEERGVDVRVVMAPLDKRFLVYMLGRGVPPPNNMTLRWCTEQIKIRPMAEALAQVAVDHGLGAMVEGPRGRPVYRGHGAEKLLVITGVRQGESAIRDGRIAMSCGRNGGECGQGWYQETLQGALSDTLAPMLHWRVCHVWEWLRHWAPTPACGDWSTEIIADAYGGDEAEEIQARTGCVGCPLANRDTALDAMIRLERWAYLRPLKGLRDLYRDLRLARYRLRKRAGERRQDGTLASNQHRMGPITLEGRHEALGRVLAIQAEVNEAAARLGRPRIDLLNDEEHARIVELIDAGTWPNKWNGSEPVGDELFDEHFADGSMQPLLAGLEEGPVASLPIGERPLDEHIPHGGSSKGATP